MAYRSISDGRLIYFTRFVDKLCWQLKQLAATRATISLSDGWKKLLRVCCSMTLLPKCEFRRCNASRINCRVFWSITRSILFPWPVDATNFTNIPFTNLKSDSFLVSAKAIRCRRAGSFLWSCDINFGFMLFELIRLESRINRLINLPWSGPISPGWAGRPEREVAWFSMVSSILKKSSWHEDFNVGDIIRL